MSTSKSFFGRLFGGLWAIVVGLYRLTVVLSVLILIALVWMAIQGGPPVKVENNVALVIYPTGTLVETLDENPSQQFLQELSRQLPSQTLLRDPIEALESAAADPRIALVVLKLDSLWSAGLPQLEELAAAMKKFRASGKPIYAYGPYYDQGHYRLAAQADHVSLDPLGMVFLEGFGVYNNYFKDAIDKLGIDVNVFRVGEYKSAVEPFERNDMSEAARAANKKWLGDLWRSYGHAIAEARKLPESAVDDYVRTMPAGLEKVHGDAATLAKESKLVDTVETVTEFRKRVAEKVGMDEEHGSFRQIHYGDYLRAIHREHPRKSSNKVALVVVQGEIVDGESEPGVAGGDTIAALLTDARLDDKVSAVVLRVDSPGGSVFASERIRREVQNLQADGKPVVVSMSSVAASGGYWISMDADEIWAHDTTITGSIGIFALFPTFNKPLAKLGIHTDGIGTTPLAGAFRGDRPIQPEVASLIQSQIEQGYRWFIDGVAQGRELPAEKVQEIAQGRVWSGVDANELGLVDHVGNLEDAVLAAARLGGLEPGSYALEEFKQETPFPVKALLKFAGRIKLDIKLFPQLAAWEQKLRRFDDATHALRWVNDPRGLYTHCFCTPAVSSQQR